MATNLDKYNWWQERYDNMTDPMYENIEDEDKVEVEPDYEPWEDE